jgi:hypothetical protein
MKHFPLSKSFAKIKSTLGYITAFTDKFDRDKREKMIVYMISLP